MKNLKALLEQFRRGTLRLSQEEWQHQRPEIKWPYDLLALFLLALFVRGVVLWTAIGQLGIDSFLTSTPDTTNYLTAARALIENSDAAESILFTFGPGFPYLLSIYLRIFGESPLPFLIIQIVLSSLSCLLIYRLSRQLLGDYVVSLVAGVIAAFSLTSISLSCLILSDTTFFFMFLLSFVLFIDGVKYGEWWRFIVSGLLLGSAILIRSIGQFWPIVLVLFAVILFRGIGPAFKANPALKSRRIRQIIVCLVISISPMLGWILRNGSVNGLYALAMTGASGPANVAALALEQESGRPFREIQAEWFSLRLQETGKQSLSLSEVYRLMQSRATEVFKQAPTTVIRAYSNLAWENVRDIDYLHRDLLPKPNWVTQTAIGFFNRGTLFVWLAITGLVILFSGQFRRSALILLVSLSYFALMVGSFKWQGSRLFHPGLIPGAILCAVTLVIGWRALAALAVRVCRRWRSDRVGDGEQSRLNPPAV